MPRCVARYDLRPAQPTSPTATATSRSCSGILLACFSVFTTVRARARASSARSTACGWPPGPSGRATSARGSAGAAATSWASCRATSTRWPRDLEEHNSAPRGAGASRPAHRAAPTTATSRRRSAGSSTRRARAGAPLAVVLLDIDDFKRINESRGHPFGDELLARAAASLQLGDARPGRGRARGRRRVRARAARRRRRARVRAGRGGPHARSRLSAPVRGSLRCSAGIACYPGRREERRRPAAARRRRAAWAKESGRGRSRRYDPEHVFVVTEEQREDFAAPDRPARTPCGRSSSRSCRWPAASRSATRRWRASRASPGCRRPGGSRRPTASGSGRALEAESVRAALAAAEPPAGHASCRST